MKLLKNRKGQVRLIEAIIATALLMSCLTLIPSQPKVNDSSSSLSSIAENTLLSLDSNGQLANLVANGNWAALTDLVESALPLTVWFNLTVFDDSMNVLNCYPICNSGAVSNNIVSLDYVCASPNSTYNIYILQLQLSQVGST